MPPQSLDPLLIQLLTQLVTPDGSLAYHMVLAFALLGALVVSLNQPRDPDDGALLRRTAWGLSLLLILQLALFVASLLALQGMVNAEEWLPPVDRAVTLVGLVFIIWLWAFPRSSPGGDSAALLLALLAITAAVLGALWWSEQDSSLLFNQTWLDRVAQITSLALLGLGVLVLSLRRAEGWMLGLVMLLLLAAGHALQLFLPLPGSDYAGAVRLAQLASAYFFFMLPQRAAGAAAPARAGLASSAVQADRRTISSQAQLYADPQVWHAVQKLVMETEPDRVCQVIVSCVARILQSDICLLVLPPDDQGKLNLRCGYDQSGGRYLEKMDFEASSLPALVSALRMGRVRRLNVHSTSLDLPGLARALHLEHTGNTLFVPILSPDGQAMAGLVLMAPYNAKDWSADEQSFLSAFGRLMVHFYQRSQENIRIKDELGRIRTAVRTAQDQAQIALEDRRKLQDQLAVLREDNQRSRAQLEGMAGLLSDQMAAQQAIEKLQTALQEAQAENEQLKRDLETQGAFAPDLGSAAPPLRKGQTLEGELRMALEEVAFLQTMLADADQKLTVLKDAQFSEAPFKAQLEEITSITEEIRQPLSSLVGYVDFLLSESVGILGSAQRKYLERIKVSVERVNRLVDDLLQVVARENHLASLDLGEANLGMILQSAVAENNKALRQKHITMRMDLGDTPLYVYTDQLALRKVLVSLFHNAASISPEGSRVSVSAHLQSSEGEEDYVLVQIADSGGGIAPQDLPHVFLPPLPGGDGRIAGISDMDMRGVKIAIESLGGRTWVDSEPGVGASFSILLPVTAAGKLQTGLQAG